MSLRAILTSPIRSRRAWLVVALLALGYVAVDFVTFQRAMVQRKPTLKRWLPYAAELGSADDLYERHPDYLYPPFFLVMLRPLTWLSPAGAAAMWQLAKYAAAGLLFAATFNLLRRTRPVSALVTGLTLLLAIRFVHSDLRHGNVNLFLAALVTGAAWLMARNRRALAGAAVAAAAAVKVSPAIWLLLLLYQRQWRALAGAAVGLALLLEVVPLFVLPAESNHRLLRSWYRHVVAGYVARGQIDPDGDEPVAGRRDAPLAGRAPTSLVPRCPRPAERAGTAYSCNVCWPRRCC
ncbi:MAG: glycosyltransferase family 87 protein [Phycisphaerae bacterium]